MKIAGWRVRDSISGPLTREGAWMHHVYEMFDA